MCRAPRANGPPSWASASWKNRSPRRASPNWWRSWKWRADMFNLSELENDALVEIFNIGVGQAAASMSAIVHEEVTMSVPAISFMHRAAAAVLLGRGDHDRGANVRVSQDFRGAFETEAIPMVPEEKSLEIGRLVGGEGRPLQEL